VNPGSGGWGEVTTFYSELSAQHGEFACLRDFVNRVAASRYASGLHPWTSMHAFCVSQVPSPSRHVEPHLRVAAKNNTLEFRYIDTAIRQRQWVRIVSTESAYDRFVTFLDELNWFGRARPGNES
jgi:hypothetical protein